MHHSRMLTGIILLSAYLSICVSFISVAASVDKIEMGYFEDKSGRATLETVVDYKLTPFSEGLRVGFGYAPIWVRLKVSDDYRAYLIQNKPVILKINPTVIDVIEIYQKCGNDVISTKIGDQLPIEKQAYPALSLNQFLENCALENSIWLKLISTSNRNSDILVLPLNEALVIDANRNIFLSFIAVSILVFMVLIYFYQDNKKDFLFLSFLVQQTILFLVIVFNSGLERLVLKVPPYVGDYGGSITSILTTIFVCVFNERVLRLYSYSKKFKPFIYAVILFSVINLAFVFSEYRTNAMFLNSTLLAISLILYFLMSLTIKNNQSEILIFPRYLVTIYYAIIALVIMPPIFPFFSVKIILVPDIAVFYSILSTVAMSTLLITRSRRIADEKAKIEIDLLLGKKEIEQLNVFRNQQERLFTMLVHEVKTPIAALKLALMNSSSADESRDKSTRHLDTVTAIINRCNQAYQLEESGFDVYIKKISPLELLDEASNDRNCEIDLRGENIPDIETDPQLLDVVIRNLLDNAARYCRKGTKPKIILFTRLEAGRTYVCVEFENKPGASGFPNPERIFEKYYRSDGAKHMSGSGLGLYLAQRIASLLGGRIEYDPSEELVRFRLWLPVST